MTVTFSQDARAGGEQNRFDVVEQTYVRVGHLRMAQVDPAISPFAVVPRKVLVLLQAGLRRVLELTEAHVAEVNAGLFTPPFVTARAVIETSCLLYRMAQEAERITKDHDRAALEQFDDRIMKAMFGGKSPEWTHANEIQALNVLTIIDNLTKTTIPDLRSMYDLLSEYAHPNYDGMIGVYQVVIERSSKFIDHPASEQRADLSTAVGMTGFGLLLTERAVAQYQALLPDFVRLCEEYIHERGVWPPDVPYPRES